MSRKTPVIWQFAVVQFERGTAINGVAITNYSSTYPDQFFNTQAIGVIRSYANRPYAGKDLFIRSGNEVHTVITKKNGAFSLWLDGVRADLIEIYDDVSCITKLPAIQSYPTQFPYADQPTEIISDIDDTIFRSYTSSFIRRVYTILFTPPKKREMVEFTTHFLAYAKKVGMRIWCVSNSEMNLFHLLAKILSLKGIEGPIVHLYNYLTYSDLLINKDKHFKPELISSILQKSAGKKFYMIGDDTGNDIRTYSEVAERFPGRICQVFIHKTKKLNSRFQKCYCQRLQKLDIPVIYFDKATAFNPYILKNVNR